MTSLVRDERYEAAVREVLDFLPDSGSGADREARAIVDRVLACYPGLAREAA